MHIRNGYKKATRYSDYAVMNYVVSLGIMVLPHGVGSLAGRIVIFACALVYLFFEKQNRKSWRCSLAFKGWALSAVVIFGLTGALQMPSVYVGIPLKYIVIAAFVAELVAIHVIWRLHLKRRLNATAEVEKKNK